MKNRRLSRMFVPALLVVAGFFLIASYASAQNGPDSGGSSSTGFKPYSGNDNIIGSFDANAQTVTLNLIGAQRGASNSFNFNGYSNGDMVIKIPEGWTATVHYTVQGSLAHSAIITPWSQRKAFSFTKAFPGAAIPDYTSGITSSDPPATFSFTASSPGKYAIVCAVPGHDDLGMWDELDVVSGVDKPEVLVK